jgi:hypothetical protein
LNDSPSSYGPFDIAFKIPCLTESNRFLSETMSCGISILISILSDKSVVLTNDKLLKFILNMSLQYHMWQAKITQLKLPCEENFFSQIKLSRHFVSVRNDN